MARMVRGLVVVVVVAGRQGLLWRRKEEEKVARLEWRDRREGAGTAMDGFGS